MIPSLPQKNILGEESSILIIYSIHKFDPPP